MEGSGTPATTWAMLKFVCKERKPIPVYSSAKTSDHDEVSRGTLYAYEAAQSSEGG